MGYNIVVMESNETRIYTNNQSENISIVCTAHRRVHPQAFLLFNSPLSYSVPLLLLQLSLTSGIILLFSLLLRPFNQPILVSQILGGLVLGPSILGHNEWFLKNLFPLRGFIMLDMISILGYMFNFFLIGVQIDPWIVKKLDRRSFSIGFFTIAVPMLITSITYFILPHIFNIPDHIKDSLPSIAQAESSLTFPTVAFLLSELKIINSEFGRVALSASIVSGLCSFSFLTFTFLAHETTGDKIKMLTTISIAIGFTLVIVFVVRPIIIWMVRKNPAGASLTQSHITTIVLVVFVAGFCSNALGLHIDIGPLVLGITMPAGPPVGSSLMDKLDLVISWLFMPVFFLRNGLSINIYSTKFKNFMVVQIMIILGAVGKFVGAFITSLHCNMPKTDALVIGLVLNAQGLLELGLFGLMKQKNVIDNESYTVMCIFVLISTAILTPIIKQLYDPTRRYIVYKRRSVMYTRHDAELRILACIHDQENARCAINFLEAMHPNKHSHLAVYVLHLIELVGRATPLLIPHKLTRKSSTMSNPSERVINAFRYFENSNRDVTSVYPFTAISTCDTMDDDVCSIALEKRTSLILLPFHNTFHVDGTVETHTKAARIMNKNVIDKAPCSVAIIVDRGLLKNSIPILMSWSSYRVAILFIGGSDDREALAIGARMVGHPNINLTIIRLIANGNHNNDEEERFDNEFLREIRHSMMENNRVMYKEEVGEDGTGTISVIRSMEKNYDLVMVGRVHDTTSPLLLGLTNWNEYIELGVIGEILASSYFMGDSTILVVQQHNVITETHI